MTKIWILSYAANMAVGALAAYILGIPISLGLLVGFVVASIFSYIRNSE